MSNNLYTKGLPHEMKQPRFILNGMSTLERILPRFCHALKLFNNRLGYRNCSVRQSHLVNTR